MTSSLSITGKGSEMYLEQKLLEICDDGLDERENDVVRVEDVDVSGRLAQLDAGDGCGLSHGL